MFFKPVQQERIHLQFCKKKKKKKKKKMPGVKRTTQNDFVYGELRRVPLQFFSSVISCWFKSLDCEQQKYVRYAYQLMLNDTENKTV